MTAKVSVITPLFNCGDYVQETIESVMNQSFTDWELIVVDDCSTDHSSAIVERLAKDDNRIKLLRNDVNEGGARSRNRAIECAAGKYIAFLDADDLWEATKLTDQLKLMKEGNIDFSFSSYVQIDELGNKLGESAMPVPRRINLRNMYFNNYIGCLTAIYDAEKLGKIYMPDVRKRQDYALWLVILSKVEFAYSTDKVLASYRIRKNSLSRNKLDAFLYYQRILIDVGGRGIVSSFLYTLAYSVITVLKQRSPQLYALFIDIFVNTKRETKSDP